MKKPTFVFLDGLRGLAAIMVIFRHAQDFFGMSGASTYLAVDVFFILSGFVIAHAYEQKLIDGTLSFKGFFQKRIIRLYPMFIVSLAIASVLAVIAGFMKGENYVLWVGYTALLTSFFITRLSINMLFTLNPPFWSLFYELIVNFLYAALAPFLTTKALLIIVSVAAFGVLYTAYSAGHLDLGFRNETIHYISGLSRSVFGILAGVLLYRLRDRLLERVNFISPWIAVGLVISVFMVPELVKYNFLKDFLIVTILFPIAILIASQFRETRFDSLLLFLGAISYPLYVLHLPILKFIGSSVKYFGYGSVEQYAPYIGVLSVAFLIVVSYVLMKYVETPIRKWLSSIKSSTTQKPLVSLN